MNSLKRVALSLLVLACLATNVAAQELEVGAAIYQQQCAYCHGELGYPGGPYYPEPEPGVNPAFYAGSFYLMRVPPIDIRAAVLYGVTGTGMTGIGGAFSNEELGALIAYIESFRR